jgi:AcrR family transcriptional regulator
LSVTQDSEPPPADRTLRSVRRRYKAEFRADLVRAAAEIIDAEGLDQLTVKRLADDFGSSVGTIYRHFESKDHLLSEARALQLEALAAAAAAHDDAVRRRLVDVDAPRDERAAARLWSAGQFWIDAAASSARVVRQARQLMSDPELGPAERDQATRALALPLAAALDDAVAAGVLRPGHTASRAALVIAVVPLPTCAPHLWDAPEPDVALSTRLLSSLLQQWGAPEDLLGHGRALLPSGAQRS